MLKCEIVINHGKEKALELLIPRLLVRHGGLEPQPTDVECTAALHHNRRMNNPHIHLIYSERKELAEPVVKIASREDWAKAWGEALGEFICGCIELATGIDMHSKSEKVQHTR